MNGVLIVDKPGGMTSHDVVQRVRRAAGTSRVGHAGTLDPMATGVLVVMLGEATKLGPYLTADDKAYRARIQLGAETDTLDADGQVVRREPLPDWWSGGADGEADLRIERALAAERERREQLPPVVSAIKIDGRPAHARARRGETVELAPRPVSVLELALLGWDPSGWIDVSVRTTKGYYVRALARDLGDALGCPAHLTALRRTASGAFTLERARVLAEVMAGGIEAVREVIIGLADAAALALPVARLTVDGAARARVGKPLDHIAFEVAPRADRATAWLDEAGKLVAVGQCADGKYSILRGFL